jgi:hypothetical protein
LEAARVKAHPPNAEVPFAFRRRTYVVLVWELDDGVRDVTVFETRGGGFKFVALGVLGRRLVLFGVDRDFAQVCGDVVRQ